VEDIAQWLGDQLAEDRAALLRYRDGHDGPCINYEGQDPAAYDEYDSCVLHLEAARATPYRDVGFGLRELDAKRKLLTEYAESEEALGSFADMVDVGRVEGLRVAVAHAALPYADRPGYREDWRP
jgi:hypothetical protein